MRFLILVLLAGCFDPSVDDCQFKCTMQVTRDNCPEGTTCRQGFCRVGNATSSCTTTNDPCMTAPTSPNNCTTRIALEGGVCATLCALTSGGDERSFTSAQSACMNDGWQLAILDTANKRNAIQSSQGFWVGAQRTGTPGAWMWLDGSPVEDAAWTGGVAPLTGNSCGNFDGPSHRLDNGTSCTEVDKYICTFPIR